MIDLEKARKAFDEYVKCYDIGNGKIANKIGHIKRVAKEARKIASQLDLEQEDISLAELIGLLHDIGRFEQVKQYDTFVDRLSINHGEFGANLLFEEGLIRNFIEDTKYDKIIKTAILNHNKDGRVIKEIPFSKEDLHTKIIRDADKIDIFYVLVNGTMQDTYCCDNMSQSIIKQEVMNQFEKEHYIDYKQLESGAEKMLGHFAYIFDLNYDSSIKIIQEKQYIDKLACKYFFEIEGTRLKIEKAVEIVKAYINERLK